MSELIRIRIATRGKQLEPADRAAFWTGVRENGFPSDRDCPVDALEGKLAHEFGINLKKNLQRAISAEFDSLDQASGIKEVRRILEERRHFRLERIERASDVDSWSWLNGFWEHRTELIRSNPFYRNIMERASAAAAVYFKATDLRYGSLDFGLAVSNLPKLAKAFDYSFPTFTAFLDVFIPETFSDLHSHEAAKRYAFDVTIPKSIEQSFSTARRESTGGEHPERPVIHELDEASARREYLWKLANGSLLIPVVILIAVLIFTIVNISKSRKSEIEVLEPLLQHYERALILERESKKEESAHQNQHRTPPNKEMQGTPEPSSSIEGR